MNHSKEWKLISFVFLFLFLSIGGSAFCGDIAIEITPQVGYSQGGEIRVVNSFFSEVSLDNGLVYGFTLGAMVTKNTGFEFAWSHQGSGLLLEEKTRIEDTNVDHYFGNFTYEWGLKQKRVRPLALVGLGLTRLAPEGFAPFSKFAANVGGGAKFFFNSRFGLRIQAVYSRTFIDANPNTLACDPVYGCFTTNGSINMNQFEIVTGVIFRM